MKIAIVGSGIAGLSAASRLYANGHQITVYEAKDYIGGHARTLQIPFGDDGSSNDNELIPVELGVFMFDPQYIHPVMGAKVRELGIKVREIPITFSFENHKYNTSWTTKSPFSGIGRDLAILFKTVKHSLIKGGLYQKVSFFLELQRFMSQMPEICTHEKYSRMSLMDYILMTKCSDCFLENWLLPQIMCWWGMTRDYVMSSNIQVIVQSMYFVSIAPQYIFEGGWTQFIEKLSEPFSSNVRTDCRVDKVVRNDKKVEVTAKGSTTIYDHVIFAAPPSVVANILQQQSAKEEALLESFPTTTTTVYLHRDTNWLPRDQEPSLVNLIQDQRGDFCTINFGELNHRKPTILVTWGDRLQETPDSKKTIATETWLRTLPTVKYTQSCHTINSIQGHQGIWYCGAHVDALDPHRQNIIPSLWHENSFKSGLQVADRILSRASK